MFVAGTLWDMGSSHKKASSEMYSLDSSSSGREFFAHDFFSFLFGGLRLCKASINASRNHSLTHDGSNYGIYILRQLKNQFEELFGGIKTSVLVGKDRQSDLLSWLTCCEAVQEILQHLKRYQIICIPKEILTYTENAKTQKRIMFPVALASNSNGDVLILDKGASCVHVVDRSSVAKIFLLGKYHCSTIAPYNKSGDPQAKHLHLSNGVTDLIVADNSLFISDEKRNEVAVIRNCSLAKQIKSCKLSIITINSVKSISFYCGNLVVLRTDIEGYLVEILTLSSVGKSFLASYKSIMSLKTEMQLKSLYPLPGNYICACTDQNQLLTFEVKVTLNAIEKTDTAVMYSKCRPRIASTSQLRRYITQQNHCVLRRLEPLIVLTHLCWYISGVRLHM